MTNQKDPQRAARGDTPTYSPAVDVEEGSSSIVLWADLPGVREEDLTITLEKDVLTLEAKVSGGPVAPEMIHQEYGVGDYRRVFTISDTIDRQKITANLKAGVLRLELPKAQPHQPRQIKVNVA